MSEQFPSVLIMPPGHTKEDLRKANALFREAWLAQQTPEVRQQYIDNILAARETAKQFSQIITTSDG